MLRPARDADRPARALPAGVVARGLAGAHLRLDRVAGIPGAGVHAGEPSRVWPVPAGQPFCCRAGCCAAGRASGWRPVAGRSVPGRCRRWPRRRPRGAAPRRRCRVPAAGRALAGTRHSGRAPIRQAPGRGGDQAQGGPGHCVDHAGRDEAGHIASVRAGRVLDRHGGPQRPLRPGAGVAQRGPPGARRRPSRSAGRPGGRWRSPRPRSAAAPRWSRSCPAGSRPRCRRGTPRTSRPTRPGSSRGRPGGGVPCRRGRRP